MRTLRCGIKLWVTVMSGSLVVAAHASEAENWTARVKSSLQPYVDSDQNVGMIVGGIHQGQDLQVALGQTVLGKESPPTADTVFQIGSVSKTFTSLLLANLVQEGRVTLNDPLSKFFPGVPELQSGPVGAITLLQLSTHTSGLPRLPANFVVSDPNDPYLDYTPELLMAALKQPGLLSHAGPYPINYSNMGGGLLGYVLTQVTGETYSQLLTERITGPLGMSHTGVSRSEAEIRASAQGYDETLTPVHFWDFLSSTVGAGGVFTTLSDMFRFMHAQLDPDQTSLGKAIALTHEVQALGSPQGVGVPVDANLGLAWILSSIDGHPIIWHNGEVGGFFSFTGIDPSTHESIEVLTNTASGRFENCVLDILVGQACPVPSSFPLNDDQLQKSVGTFDTPGATVHTIQVSRRENFLMVELDGQASFRLYPTGPDQFQISGDAIGTLAFQPDASGALNQLTLSLGGESSIATRVAQP